jgi:heterodisulfide reductase subunit B2
MKYSYFPGCSLKGLGKAYEESLLPVLKHLGVELKEIDDWNCCGATACMAVDEVKACVLAARNLGLAQKSGFNQIVAPCASCYLVLNKTRHYINEFPAMKEKVVQALAAVDLKYDGDTPVRHPLDILINDVGLEAIKQKVTHPLKGLKVAPYYGCQIVRPYATFDDQNNPTTMDRLIEALGATVVNYPLKTKCCGGSLTGGAPGERNRCVFDLLTEAENRGADCLATVCPLCQFNLDASSAPVAAKFEPVNVPAVYFSQLMGMAFGLSADPLAIDRSALSALGSQPMCPRSAHPIH